MLAKRRVLVLLAAAILFCLPLSSALAAYKPTTLCNGMRGEEVTEIQEALITLGYLKGPADGVFGNKTENAVRKFQKKNKLDVDGLVGTKTKELLLKKAAAASSGSSQGTHSSSAASGSGSASSSGIFGGNYATLRSGSSGARVRTLQKALITLKHLSGKADGKYGAKTRKAVKAFQRSKKLKADGIAGKKTLKAIEKALKTTETAQEQESTPAEPDESGSSASSSEGLNEQISSPAVGEIKLLRWYDDIKPKISNKQTLLVYEPVSGLSWTLSILSRGRHCDAEPLTSQDTKTMLKAFGNKNTWNQKGVYVRLPDGRWTIGSTHDMPHESGSIKNNNFNGHLCVHFLRTMEETRKNDPNYGVSNQETIRALWKSLTGEDIQD